MKKFLYIFTAVILFTSCSPTFYYATLNTATNYVEKVENGDFLFDTDSLWIAYSFRGESAPMQITIFNKMDKPLYVDWLRSGLVTDGDSQSYANGEIVYSQDNSTIYQQKTNNIGVVPPNSMISKIPLFLSVNFDDISKNTYTEDFIDNKYNKPVNVKGVNFSPADSPLKLHSYLTLFSSPETPVLYQQDFYLSNLKKTKSVAPEDLPEEKLDSGDFFFIEKRPRNNGFIVFGTSFGSYGGGFGFDIVIDPTQRY